VSRDGIIPLYDPLLGAMVGDYQVIEPIGEGGMGVVYRGIQPIIKKRFAIKVLKSHVAADTEQVRRLVAEAEAVNAIGHRGIIDIFGLGQLPDGRPYIVMEYLDGQPLDGWIQKHPGGIPLLDALQILIELCAALAAAHRANVIHRDLKPSNIFVCKQADGTRFLKILDFGLAKRISGIDGNSNQTSLGSVSGTPNYMSPEQERGLVVSTRSDVYSLGILAYELLTLKVPFEGDTAMDVMVAHVGGVPAPPQRLTPNLPAELNQLVLEMLAKNPDHRPQTVDEVREQLEACVAMLMTPPPEPVQPAKPVFASALPRRNTSEVDVFEPRSRFPVLKVTGAVLVALLGGAYFYAFPPTRVWVTSPVSLGPKPAVDELEKPTEEIKSLKRPTNPSNKQLQDRILKLEARAHKKTDIDTVALQQLNLYKIEAEEAETPADRAQLEKTLSSWEKLYLNKK
jgi:serine/threonine protein kinase